MTREEQIKQAADEYMQTFKSGPRGSFINGAKWADQHPNWIPVEERLPEERKVVWVRKHFNKEVLGEFDIYDSAAFCNGEFQCDNSGNITHWMPMPAAPTKEGGQEDAS